MKHHVELSIVDFKVLLEENAVSQGNHIIFRFKSDQEKLIFAFALSISVVLSGILHIVFDSK